MTVKRCPIPAPVQTSGSAWGIRPKAVVRHRTGEMNQTEKRYACYLDALRLASEVQWWGFEVLKIRLADNTFYTVDFAVVLADGSLEFHETKAMWQPKFDARGNLVKGARAGWKEDARIKMRVAAELFPGVWKGVAQMPITGEWREEIFGG